MNVMPNSERGVNLLPGLFLRLFRVKRLVPEKMKGTGYFFCDEILILSSFLFFEIVVQRI
ncbi:hypothetical protein HMPREF0542_10504 [Ligilactobacillus ruminis ATCC 25644]|uniref:Uncharacterized protein n=1 Tax=Ligilactobacillus ruminis ATCC 25644 TaxID=525362 RepID=E7FNM7_9LACO|nr:hypothetical protein HMPREF0542_10504 [Ligilactobacillus ruminis ATCC 25644]EGX97874.1 hypothetical protein ANHS_1635 [Ligilactobacillus ruminis ATCC 25644]